MIDDFWHTSFDDFHRSFSTQHSDNAYETIAHIICVRECVTVWVWAMYEIFTKTVSPLPFSINFIFLIDHCLDIRIVWDEVIERNRIKCRMFYVECVCIVCIVCMGLPVGADCIQYGGKFDFRQWKTAFDGFWSGFEWNCTNTNNNKKKVPIKLSEL